MSRRHLTRRTRNVRFIAGALSAAVLAGLLANIPAGQSALVRKRAGTAQPTAVDKSSWPVWERQLPISAAQEAHLNRRPDSVSWQNADGTRTAAMFGVPVNYLNDQQQWQPTDTRLSATSDGRQTAASTPVGVSFAGSTTAMDVGLLSHDGMSVRFGFQGLGKQGTTTTPVSTGRHPTVSSAAAHDQLEYTAPLPNTHLDYKITTTGVKETLTLDTPLPAASDTTLRFPLQLSGLTPVQQQDGSIVFNDDHGNPQLLIPVSRAIDSSKDPNTGFPATTNLSMSLDTTGGATTLLMTIDPTWLNDPGRVYPVMIDPSYTWDINAVNDAFVIQELPSNNYDGINQYNSGCSCYYDWAGVLYPSLHASSLEHLGDLSPMSGKHIISAALNEYSLTTTSGSASFTVKPVSSSWTSSSVTYGTLPSMYSSSATGSVPSSSAQWVTTDITSFMTNWANGTYANNGIYLTGPTSNAIGFAAVENGAFYLPYIAVTYNSIPAVPTTPLVDSKPTTATNATTPTLGTTVSDLDGGNLQTDYEIWNSGHTGSAIVTGSGASAPSGDTSSWTVPSGHLSASTTYSYRYKADDGTDVSAWSAWQTLTVDTTAPNAPGVSSTTWTSGAWSSTIHTSGNFTFSNGGSSDVVGYDYGLDEGDNPSQYSTSTAVTVPANSGWHTLTVRSVDAAGNVSPTTNFSFGNGAGGLSSPAPDAGTGKNFVIAVNSSSSFDGVKIQYRRSESDTWVKLPVADTTFQASGLGIGSWPVACTPSGSCGSTPRNYLTLVWNAAHTLSTAGPVQIRGDFYLGGTDQAKWTTVLNLIYDPNQFGGGYASAQVGPGSVNLLTGNYALSAEDVSLHGLGLDRTFNSRDPNNATGFFGPGWTSTTGPGDTTYQTLTDNTTNVVVTDKSGGIHTFRTQTDGSYASQDGSTDLTLVKCTGINCHQNVTGRFELNLLGFTTWGFESPGTPVTTYSVTDVTNATGTTGSTKWTVDSGGVARPQYEIAQAPSGVDCSSLTLAESTAGCHTLTFTYASSTTATGTSEANWGDYLNHLSTVTYWAFDPSSGLMNHVDVASYLYDSTGHLRTGWDPRITPALKTRYSYISSGQIQTLTPPALQAWTLNYASSAGDLSTLQRPTLNASGTVDGTGTTTVEYNIPIHGSGAPHDLSPSATAAWAQTDNPTDATAIFPSDGNPPSDYTRATIYYLDINGFDVNVAQPGNDNISTTEFDNVGNVIRTLSPGNRAAALASSSSVAVQAATAVQLDTHNSYDSLHNDRLTETFGPAHNVELSSGSVVLARQHIHTDYDQGTPGGEYDLPTTVTETAAPVDGSTEQDSRATTNLYAIGSNSSGWTFGKPLTVTVDSGTGTHLNLTTTTLYDTTTGQLTARRLPANPSGGDAHETDFIYYTAGTNTQDASCGNRPQWAELPCKQQPAAQPGGSLPDVPVPNATAYNMWEEPTTTIERSGSTTRTTTDGYDAAGRPTTNSITSNLSGAQAIPQITAAYDTSTGLGTTATDGTLTTSHAYDSLGRSTSYTDADGNTSSYTYDHLNRVATLNDGKATTTYTYNTSSDPRGVLTSISDADVGTFSATYNVEGQLATETYPGGLTAAYTYDPSGAATKLSYDKSGNWINEQQITNIHGQVMFHDSQLSADAYNYDAAGRLTEVVDIASGQGCVIRSYSFDADSNRLGLNAQQPNADDGCPTAGSVATTNTYDAADRIANSGYSYDALGRTTAIPASDVPNATATNASYFVNDLTYQLTQGSSSRTYSLDPNRRYRNWTDGTSTHTNHYAGDSDAARWTNESSTSWTRYVPGFTGLGAIETSISGTTATALQLSNLHGDVVAQTTSAATSMPTNTQETTEYGVARTGTGQRYDYLGEVQRTRDDLSGLVLMGRRLYDPATGRFSSPDPVLGGNANSQGYPTDPVNSNDTSGACRAESKYFHNALYCLVASDGYWAAVVHYGTWTRFGGPGLWVPWCLGGCFNFYGFVELGDAYRIDRMEVHIKYTWQCDAANCPVNPPCNNPSGCYSPQTDIFTCNAYRYNQRWEETVITAFDGSGSYNGPYSWNQHSVRTYPIDQFILSWFC